MALNAVNLSSAGNAISEGLDAYLKAKQMKDQRDFQQQQLSLGAAEKGLIPDQNNPGGFLPGAAAQGKLNYEKNLYDPSSPNALSAEQELRQVYKNQKVKDQDLQGLVPSGLSAKEYQDKLASAKANNPMVIALGKEASNAGKADKNTWKDYSKRLDSDKVYQKALSGEAEVNNSMAALDQASGGNPMAGNSIPIVMARLATGGQRLNQTEIQMLGGSKAVGARLSAALEQAKTGNMTPENIDFAKRVVQASARADAQNKESAILRHATRAANEQNTDVDEAYERISGFPREKKGLVQSEPQIGLTAQAPAQESGLMSTLKGLLPGGGAPTSPAQAQPQTMVKDGHTYTKTQGGWTLVEQ